MNGTLWRDEGLGGEHQGQLWRGEDSNPRTVVHDSGDKKTHSKLGGGGMGRMDTGCRGREPLEGLYSGLSHENSDPG